MVLITHSHLLSRLRKSRAIPLLLICAYIAMLLGDHHLYLSLNKLPSSALIDVSNSLQPLLNFLHEYKQRTSCWHERSCYPSKRWKLLAHWHCVTFQETWIFWLPFLSFTRLVTLFKFISAPIKGSDILVLTACTYIILLFTKLSQSISICYLSMCDFLNIDTSFIF
jgi:hypothetical protein